MGIVGCEEKDAGDQELIVDALALDESQWLSMNPRGTIVCLPSASLLHPGHAQDQLRSGALLAGGVTHWLYT